MRRRTGLRLAGAGLAGLLLAGCVGWAREDSLVRVDGGQLRGVVAADHRSFQGIPYAAPPEGGLRWRDPEPVRPWTGVREATKPGSPCPQEGTPYAPTRSTDEDCLFLNVTTPRHGKGKPVMVWLHGDGVVGSGALFDGVPLATAGDVVVVTVNYRLGVFGGFGLPGLAGSGTFGLADQQAALRWVRDNIAAFGGDPGNVTLFGTSYGASATTAHLVSPSARGLFHRASVHSGQAMMPLPAGAVLPGVPAVDWFTWRALAETEQLGTAMAAELGCAEQALDCMRKLPVDKLFPLMRLFQSHAFGGPLLPEVPAAALRAGKAHPVPVVLGMTRDEHRTFTGLFRGEVKPEEYPVLLREAFGDKAERIERAYPVAEHGSPALAWSAVLTDGLWAKATAEQAGLGAGKTWAYVFNDREAPSYLPFPPGFPPGAFHASDTPYLFPDKEFRANARPDQRALAERMTRQWTAFARTGSPNGPGLPHWPEYGAGKVLGLDPAGSALVDFAAQHRLGFWRGLG
ncbi:para-nitrobenzyl esterase [Crossiella equi]|uniref:Para-nitrobenzyl esterase n=1 Tax=Crossiella equi TaxID=130796 RepID=A0ABS5ADI5_9PSEU|nr:carboxylesterase family protein [Crossiella equi]MBP2474650.1 para-nitrobenzyl esterase [Crossiella equi]